jgi:ABC-type Fe3+ transport system permease subunit
MKKAFDNCALVLFSVTILVPFFYFLASSLLSFNVSALNITFFWVLLRAWFAGFVQAALSATFVCVLASFFALSLLQIHPQKQLLFSRLNSGLGRLYFVLPGTVLSLVFLTLPKWLTDPLSGWPLIIAAHTFWSLLLMSDLLHRKLAAWLNHEGRDLLCVAQTLGASPLQATQNVLWPYLKTELREIFVLVFVWSFGAFSTVFLLGKGPQHSTLEVLTYYTLFNDLDSTRLVILVLMNLLTQFFVLKKFYLDTRSQGLASQQISLQKSQPIHLGLPKCALLSVLFTLFFAIALLAKHLLGLGLDTTAFSELQLESSLWNSLRYALSTSFMGLLLGFLVSGMSTQLRRSLLVLFAISPMVLAALWSQIRLEFFPFLESSLTLSAFALCLTQVPLLALWIDSSLSNLDSSHESYLNTLGLSPIQKFLRFRLPYLRDVLLQTQVLLFSLALGDLVMSSSFAPRDLILSQLARKLSQSYAFDGASWVLISTLALMGIWILFLDSFKKFLARNA